MANVTSRVDGNKAEIVVDGRFDFNLHRAFREAYRNLAPAHAYVVNLSRVAYLDSSALGMLLLLREHAGGDKANVRITGCQPDVRNILGIANFHRLFKID